MMIRGHLKGASNNNIFWSGARSLESSEDELNLATKLIPQKHLNSDSFRLFLLETDGVKAK